MRISEIKRRKAWDSYEMAEFELRQLKSIVQNDVEISGVDLEFQKNLTDKLIGELKNIQKYIEDNCK